MTTAARRVNTDGIVLRDYRSSLSSKATTRYRAHNLGCRFAGSATQSMTELIERLDESRVRVKVAVGTIQPCGDCKPMLLIETPTVALVSLEHLTGWACRVAGCTETSRGYRDPQMAHEYAEVHARGHCDDWDSPTVVTDERKP